MHGSTRLGGELHSRAERGWTAPFENGNPSQFQSEYLVNWYALCLTDASTASSLSRTRRSTLSLISRRTYISISVIGSWKRRPFPYFVQLYHRFYASNEVATSKPVRRYTHALPVFTPVTETLDSQSGLHASGKRRPFRVISTSIPRSRGAVFSLSAVDLFLEYFFDA